MRRQSGHWNNILVKVFLFVLLQIVNELPKIPMNVKSIEYYQLSSRNGNRSRNAAVLILPTMIKQKTSRVYYSNGIYPYCELLTNVIIIVTNNKPHENKSTSTVAFLPEILNFPVRYCTLRYTSPTLLCGR